MLVSQSNIYIDPVDDFSSIGYTRITDHHHQWEDVLADSIVDALVAILAFRFLLIERYDNSGVSTNTFDRQRALSP
jgi:hypothetical protein